MLRCECWAPLGQDQRVVDHVRAHLSAVASTTDDPDEFYAEVLISHGPFRKSTDSGMQVLIQGALDRPARAFYLDEDFGPEDEARANPLSIPSVSDGEGT